MTDAPEWKGRETNPKHPAISLYPGPALLLASGAMSISRPLQILLLFGSCLTLSPPRHTSAQDFSKGFEMLVKLGLPDTKGWKYVEGERPDRFSQQIEGWKRSGHYWIETEADADGIRRMTDDGLNLSAMVLPDRENPEKTREQMRSLQSKGLQPRWQESPREKEGDEAADAAGLMEALKAEFEKGERSRGSRALQDKQTLASLFFHAAHWHRRGYEKEAAELVNLIMEKLPRKAALLESAIAAIANHRQQQASNRFGASQDWAAYQAELEGILTNFPRSWPERPLTVRLVEKLKARAAGGDTPVKSDGVFPLTAEQVAWWENYGKPKESAEETMMYGGYGNDISMLGQAWMETLFPKSDAEQDSANLDYQTEQARNLGFDVANGWNWLEVMAAGLGDETLVPTNAWDYSYSRSYSWGDLDEEPAELEGEELEDAWRSLARPRSRDEIARSFLKGIVPQPEDSDYEWWETAEAGEIVEVVKTWRDKMAGKSGNEIAELYFEEGDENWKERAAAVKVRIGSEEEVAELAEMVLAAPSSGISLAVEIVRRRGTEGRAFYEAFLEGLKQEIVKEEGNEALTPEQIESRIDSYYGYQIKAMEAILSGEGFADLFAAFVADEKTQGEFGESMQALGKQPSTREEAEAAMAGVLELQNPTPERRGFALSVAGHVARLHLNAEDKKEGGDADDEAKDEDRPLPEWMRESFARLIEQVGNEPVSYNAIERPLTQVVHFTVDSLVNPAASQKTGQYFRGLLEEDIWTLLDARGRARMAGEAPPETPTADSVPANRKGEIEKGLTGLATMSATDWDAWVTGLTVSERMLLRDLLAAAEPDAAQKVLVFRIGAVEGGVDAAWKDFETAKVEPATLENLFAKVREKAGEKRIEVWLTRSPLLGGFQIRVLEKSPEEFSDRFASDPFGNDSGGETLDFDAVASFGFGTRSGASSKLEVRGKDGVWKAHEGERTPQVFYTVMRGEPLAPDKFAEELATTLEEWEADDDSLYFHFAATPLPKPKEDEKP